MHFLEALAATLVLHDHGQGFCEGLPIADRIGAAKPPHRGMQANAIAMAWQVMNLPPIGSMDTLAEHLAIGTSRAAMFASHGNCEDLVA